MTIRISTKEISSIFNPITDLYTNQPKSPDFDVKHIETTEGNDLNINDERINKGETQRI